MFRNLFLSWLAFSQQLESTIFNYSLALCLSLMGEFFFMIVLNNSLGVLGPLSGFTMVVVSQQEEGSEERLFWCQVMALQRNLINVAYVQTFFFNCVWRVVH